MWQRRLRDHFKTNIANHAICARDCGIVEDVLDVCVGILIFCSPFKGLNGAWFA